MASSDAACHYPAMSPSSQGDCLDRCIGPNRWDPNSGPRVNRCLRTDLRPYVRVAPVAERDDFPTLSGTCLQFKFELLQVSGTSKARGAFSSLLALNNPARLRGVTAISSGNHAVAVAYAAMRLGISAKVVMVKTANPARVALAQQCGAEVLLVEGGVAGFAKVREIERDEGRFFVHPFNSYRTVLGTATLGAVASCCHGAAVRRVEAGTEPACAAATAAALGPLREKIVGQRIGVLLCGTNTDLATFGCHLSAA